MKCKTTWYFVKSLTFVCKKWRSQEFRLGDKIESKKLINIDNKINKQLYANVFVI